MTHPLPGFLSLLRRRAPRTPPDPGWEERRAANEAAFWAENLRMFETALPRIREHRGNARAARLTRDVLAAVGQARGPDEAVLARDRLAEVWRGARGRL